MLCLDAFSCQFVDKCYQLVNVDASPARDIIRSSFFRFAREKICIDHVVHEREIPALLTIPVYNRWRVAQYRGDEFWNHRRVLRLRVLSWSKHVKVAQRDGRQTVDLAEHLTVELTSRLRHRIRR